MKIGIIGLANAGKTALFNALTGLDVPVTEYVSKDPEPHVGIVKVPDDRLEALAEIYRPKKVTRATVEYADCMGIVRGDPAQNRRVADLVKDVDAVLQVVRGFEDPSIAHPLEGVDPPGDAACVELELVLSDLELVETRLERMAAGDKKGRPADPAERSLLLRCLEVLEAGRPLRRVGFTAAETRMIRHLQFTSIKPALMVLNVHENDTGSDREAGMVRRLSDTFGFPVIPIPVKIEMEISQLPPEEVGLFLQDLGIEESAMSRVINCCYQHLGLISFITVGADEVRAWTVRKDTPAVKAAGKIHSDIERGFIRAEIVSFTDFRDTGSMAAARDRGVVRLEGKTYPVCDGDIATFRFNV